ncbi:MAG TPA: T9SS type A sorting domain-containing protein, partial [Sunxiuqinia sp.]|nr:T9SS type A sorting domain-containing protein [Sunxiuqinia sp.]
LFFANSDSTSNVFVTDGVNNVVVDTMQNKIYAQIAHFSTIVARPGKSSTTNVNDLKQPAEGFLDNYPNPFSNQTTLRFKVAEKAHVSIDVYSLNGQKIRSLVDRDYQVGSYELLWNARNENNAPVAPGVYIGRMMIDQKVKYTTRMLIAK